MSIVLTRQSFDTVKKVRSADLILWQACMGKGIFQIPHFKSYRGYRSWPILWTLWQIERAKTTVLAIDLHVTQTQILWAIWLPHFEHTTALGPYFKDIPTESTFHIPHNIIKTTYIPWPDLPSPRMNVADQGWRMNVADQGWSKPLCKPGLWLRTPDAYPNDNLNSCS